MLFQSTHGEQVVGTCVTPGQADIVQTLVIAWAAASNALEIRATPLYSNSETNKLVPQVDFANAFT